MSLKRTFAALCFLFFAAGPVAAAPASPVIDKVVVEPALSIKQVPITDESRPFLAARADLAANGYVEEEFFVSGTARTYEWAGESLKIRAVTSAIPYTTRILVWRPADPTRFSGDIEVETLNATTGMDISTTTGTSAQYIMRRGDVWVGITSKPLTVQALKRFDPSRYGPLDWGNPAPAAQRCARPTIIPKYAYGDFADKAPATSFPESEDGLVWDMYAQLGAFLKSDRRGAILPDFGKPRLYATGYSQSALIQRTFISGFHKVMRLPDGERIFDGYLVEVGPAMLRINQCSRDVMPQDPLNHLPKVDAPVINLYSEGDMWLGVQTRQPDWIEGRTGLVTYEIAGAAHPNGMKGAGRPTPEEAARAGFASPMIPPQDGLVLNDMPRGYLSTAALDNLKAWSKDGVAPPQGRLIELSGGDIARDADGNALGGVRNPWIDAPTATYQGALGLGALSIVGRKTPYSPERLKALYPDGGYAVRLQAAVDRAVNERWLLAEDSAVIVEQATAQGAN